MLIEPKGAAAAKGEPAEVQVCTFSSERILKPAENPDVFAEAATAALTEAEPKHAMVTFVGVAEFIASSSFSDGLEYRYVWRFQAHRG